VASWELGIEKKPEYDPEIEEWFVEHDIYSIRVKH
jgi:hypothetical protein